MASGGDSGAGRTQGAILAIRLLVGAVFFMEGIKKFLFPFVTRGWNIFQAETLSDLLNAVSPKIIDATFAQRLRGIRAQLLMFNPSTKGIGVYA